MFDREIWTRGEALAQKHLKKIGLKILAANYRTPYGEIDIIAEDGDYTVFVEVKARSTAKFGQPCEAVTPHKQTAIRRVASAYLISQNNYPSPMRFDVVEVLDGQINHIENAF